MLSQVYVIKLFTGYR